MVAHKVVSSATVVVVRGRLQAAQLGRGLASMLLNSIVSWISTVVYTDDSRQQQYTSIYIIQ